MEYTFWGEGQFITSKGASKRKTRHKPDPPKPKGPHQLWSIFTTQKNGQIRFAKSQKERYGQNLESLPPLPPT